MQLQNCRAKGILKDGSYFVGHNEPRGLRQPGDQTAACTGLLDLHDWWICNNIMLVLYLVLFLVFLFNCETYPEQKEGRGKHTCWLEPQTEVRSARGLTGQIRMSIVLQERYGGTQIRTDTKGGFYFTLELPLQLKPCCTVSNVLTLMLMQILSCPNQSILHIVQCTLCKVCMAKQPCFAHFSVHIVLTKLMTGPKFIRSSGHPK